MTIIGAWQEEQRRLNAPWALELAISEHVFQDLWDQWHGFSTYSLDHGRSQFVQPDEDTLPEDAMDESSVYFQREGTDELYEVEIIISVSRFTPPPPEDPDNPPEVEGQMELA